MMLQLTLYRLVYLYTAYLGAYVNKLVKMVFMLFVSVSVSSLLMLAIGYKAYANVESVIESKAVITGEVIEVIAGQTKLMTIPGIKRVSIGEAQVANAQSLGDNEILITGLKQGITDFRVWQEDSETGVVKQIKYMLQVVDQSWQQTLALTRVMLSDIEGVSVRQDSGLIFIEGRIIREQDNYIINVLKEKLADQVAKGTVIFNIVPSNVSLKAMIMLDVQVVEIRKTDLNKIGIQWDASAAGPIYEVSGPISGIANFEKEYSFFGLAGKGGDFTDPLTSIGSTINLLEQSGIATVLAQPKLVTRSGSSADFLVGGEVPIPIRGADGELTVDFKQVGVILNFSPETDPDGYIATKINVEVSAIDESIKVRDIPGFISRKTSMEMNVQTGQTMVISGMLQTEDGKSISKVPGLGSIPILGELFKSRDFQNRTTELVIFVTPFLIDPESDFNEQMISNIQTDYEQSAEQMKFSIYD